MIDRAILNTLAYFNLFDYPLTMSEVWQFLFWPNGQRMSLEQVATELETLRNNAYEESSDLAKEKGSFPKFNKQKYLKAYHIKNLPKMLQKKITKQKFNYRLGFGRRQSDWYFFNFRRNKKR